MKVTKVLYMLWVTDMDRAVRFYRDVLGLNVHAQSPNWSELTLGDSTVALHQGSNDSFRMTGLSFEVDDIDEACREIEVRRREHRPCSTRRRHPRSPACRRGRP